MNNSVYVFGSLRHGYTQYPNDYAYDIFENSHSKSRSKTQIVVHRDGNIMYYTYLYKLDTFSQYIGFSVLLNDVMFIQFEKLFLIFENAIADMVARGEILQFNDNGDIIAAVDILNDKCQEVERVAIAIKNEVTALDDIVAKLPPVSYEIAKNDYESFSVTDNNDIIVRASCKYSYVCIYKEKDYETLSFSSYRNNIKRLNKDKTDLLNKYEDLLKRYNALKIKKKQYLKVIFLCLVIVVSFICLFFMKGILNITSSNLKLANNKITQKEIDLKSLNKENANLKSSLRSEKYYKFRAEKELMELRDSIRGEYDSDSITADEEVPIEITKIDVANVTEKGSIETNYGENIFSDFTMYIQPRITYSSNVLDDNTKITLNIRFFAPSGLVRNQASPSGFTSSESFYARRGIHTHSFQSWGGSSKGFWPSGNYTIEFWYKDLFLLSKTFKVL
jgi:hypothetical protein